MTQRMIFTIRPFREKISNPCPRLCFSFGWMLLQSPQPTWQPAGVPFPRVTPYGIISFKSDPEVCIPPMSSTCGPWNSHSVIAIRGECSCFPVVATEPLYMGGVGGVTYWHGQVWTHSRKNQVATMWNSSVGAEPGISWIFLTLPLKQRWEFPQRLIDRISDSVPV